MINHILASLFDTDKLVLHQQLIYPTGTGTGVLHHEVLTRFKDKHNKVLLPPGEFIETLERHNLQVELDRYVICKVLQALAQQQDVDAVDIYHINISPKSVHILPEILHNYPVTLYKRLSFELTENSLVDLSLNAASKLRYLRDLGISLSFDDFGSKFVSYKEIYNIKPDYLKIDGAYVKNAATCNFACTVVKNIIALAHAIDACTVAESVEDADIADFMTELGVDYLQGWHIGKLVPLLAPAGTAGGPNSD